MLHDLWRHYGPQSDQNPFLNGAMKELMGIEVSDNWPPMAISATHVFEQKPFQL